MLFIVDNVLSLNSFILLFLFINLFHLDLKVCLSAIDYLKWGEKEKNNYWYTLQHFLYDICQPNRKKQIVLFLYP